MSKILDGKGMSDSVFAELAAMVRLSDDELWERRDREVAARRASENSGAEADRMAKRASLLRENGFPNEMLCGALLERPIETFAFKHAAQARQLPMKQFVFAGAVGTGKSTAACWLALKRFDSEPGFLRASELERRGRYDKALAEWLKSRTSLVIDDLGVEVLDSKGVFVSLFDEIVDRFYSARAIMIITTNLREEQLAERYEARAWSRFKQRGVWCSCGTRDLRRERP